jgi:hypothetical protein
MEKFTKNFLEEKEDDKLGYLNKMRDNTKKIQSKNYYVSFFNEMGKQWESLIYNYFKLILGSEEESCKQNLEYTESFLLLNMASPNSDYFKLKGESKFLKKVEDIYIERKSNDPTLKDSTNENDSKNSGSDSKKTIKKNNSQTTSNNLPLNGLQLLDQLSKKNVNRKEIEIDGYFLAKGKSYKDLRENFYMGRNDSYYGHIIDENEYEIFVELGLNLQNNWHSKFKQIAKLSCFLESIKGNFGGVTKNFIIQFVFNSNLSKFQKTMRDFNDLIVNERQNLFNKGILLFIDYINLPVYYSLQISSDDVVMEELKTLREKNEKMTAENESMKIKMEKEMNELRENNSLREKEIKDLNDILKKILPKND